MTHEQEKLEALRNSVVNAAMPDAPDATIQAIFLNAVRDLTPWHIRILKWLQNPLAWCEHKGVQLPSKSSSISLGAFLEMSMPKLKERPGFYKIIVTEFFRREFMTTQNLDTSMGPTPSGLYAERLTPLGDDFVRFIEAPS